MGSTHGRRRASLLAGLAPLVCGMVLGGCARGREQRPWVHSLELRGVHGVSRRDLAGGLASAPTPWWSLRRRRPFEELELDADRERVLRYYQARGYFDAAVDTLSAKPHAGGRSVDVLIAVDEGVPTRLDDLRVLGTAGLAPELRHLLEAHQLELRRGQVFVHGRYLALKDRLAGELKDHGYPWAAIDGDVRVDRARATAQVRIDVEPGAYCRIGRIELDAGPDGRPGEDPTRVRLRRRDDVPIDPRLLVRTFGVAAGRPFKLAELEEGRARLLQLRVFSGVMMTYERDPAHSDVVDVRLRLTGASLHELRVGGGVGIEAQRNEVRLQLLYTKRSFLGGLRTLELRLRPAYVVVPAVWSPIVRHGPAVLSEAVFTQPSLGPFSKLTFTLGYDLGVEYAYQYHGPRTQLGVVRLLWRDRISLALSYNFQLLDFFATAPEILGSAELAGARYGYTDPYRLGWWQEDVRLDVRDDRIEPRRGYYLAVGSEQGGVYAGGAFTYEKLTAETRGYAPLGGHVVLAGRIAFGQLWAQGANGSPITRRLALGGATTHRGFSEGRLSPQVPVANGAALPIGGDQSFLVSAEVRVDLVRLAGSWLAAAAFVDAGDVGAARGDTASGARSGVDFLHLHCAVGGGLRYRTPIGTVRADVGVRVNRLAALEADGRPNPDPGDRVAFHLSLAEPF